MDPIDPRRAGTRRLRLATAAVAGGALVGTAALTVAVAQAHPASATSADATTSDSTTGDGTAATGGSSSVQPAPGAPAGGLGSRLRRRGRLERLLVTAVRERPVATADWTAWTCRVRLAVTDPAALAPAAALVRAELAAVDRACSRFRPDGELAAVDAAAGRWTPVGPLLAEALAVALHAARLTGGDVDPTVGGALVALGYDRDLDAVDPGSVPPVLAPVAGWQTVELDPDAGRVRVPYGVRLDLGATAKAWTADRAAAAVARSTGAGALVSIGGDVAVAGPAPDGGWRVRVEDVTGDPAAPGPAGSTLVSLTDGGLATSGTRSRRWQRGGVEVHHVLDPRTGLPAAPAWRTVERGGRQLRGGQHRQHRGDRPRARRGALVARAGAARAPGHRARRRAHHRGVAGVSVLSDGGFLWYLNRATGLVALALMTLTVVLGVVVRRQGRLPGLVRSGVVGLHRNVSLVSAVLLVAHVASAVVDGYVSIGWLDAVVPFVAGYESLWVGLGTLAVDVLLVVVATSLLRGRLPVRVWRAVHLTSYGLWPLAFAHGLGAGTDLGSGWALAGALGCAGAVVAATAVAAADRLRARPPLDRAPDALAQARAALATGRPAAASRNR